MTSDDLVKGDSFVKVDCGILDSSLYYADRRDQRSVFLTALWMAKPFELTEPLPQINVRNLEPTGWIVPRGWYGIVRASAIAIMQRDGIDREKGIEAGYAALEALGSRDDDSRSKDYDGRRLVRVDGGYIVLNYFTYRDRDYNAAARMRAMRARRKAGDDLFGAGDGDGEPGAGAAPAGGGESESAELPPERVTNDVSGDERLRNVTHSIEQKAEAETSTTTDKSVALVPSGKSGKVAKQENGTTPLPAISGKRNLVSIRDRLIAVTEELTAGTRARLKREQVRTLQAEMLFAYWQAKFNKPRAWMDDKREKLLIKRLEENKGDLSELFYVLDGALTDEWVTGKAQNARHPNDGIEYIFRDRAHVERFATRVRGYRQDKPHPMSVKYAAIFADAEPMKQLGAGAGDVGENKSDDRPTE